MNIKMDLDSTSIYNFYIKNLFLKNVKIIKILNKNSQ